MNVIYKQTTREGYSLFYYVNSRRNYRYLVHGKLSSEIITEE